MIKPSAKFGTRHAVSVTRGAHPMASDGGGRPGPLAGARRTIWGRNWRSFRPAGAGVTSGESSRGQGTEGITATPTDLKPTRSCPSSRGNFQEHEPPPLPGFSPRGRLSTARAKQETLGFPEKVS